MPVVDVIFEKLEANRNEINVSGSDFKVNSNSTIKKIEKKEVSGVVSIVVHFELNTEYTPNVGNIKIGGQVVYLTNKITDTIKEEKGKLAFKDMSALEEVQNVILRTSTLEALWLAKEARLPPPIQLPSVVIEQPKVEENKKGYA